MANYGFDDLVVSFDNSGGTPVTMTTYITSINEINVEAVTEESHAAGDSWVEHLFTGLKRTGDITLGGFYDDTATTGPNAIFNSIGDTRTLAVTYGSTKSSTVETLIVSYKRMPARGELTKFEVTLRPTGAVTEA